MIAILVPVLITNYTVPPKKESLEIDQVIPFMSGK